MDLDTQGTVTDVASAAQVGQGAAQPASATSVDPNILPFVVEPSATEQQGQGGLPSADPNASQGVDTQSATDERFRQIQSEKDRVYSQNLALQQQMQQLQAQQAQFLAQFTPQSQPPDQTTDPVGYLRWEIKESQKSLLAEAERRNQAQIQQMLAGAAEMQWTNSHPGVDVNSVKAFNRMNGIAEWNLDAGHKLMTMPSQVQNVARNAINQTFNEIRKPQNGASPMRGAASTGQGAIQLSWEKMAQAYNQNPNIESTWSPELKKFFWDGTAQLQRQQ